MSSDLEMDSQNTISLVNSASSSSSDDSSSSTTSSSHTILSPASSNASSFPPAPSSFENQTTLNRPVFKASWSSSTTPSLPSMPSLPDLVVSTPRRSSTASSIASSSSSSSFASYLPQHQNPPPLPPIPAVYSTSSRKPHAEEFRPQVQHVKQLEDKRARTRAILAAQASPSAKKSEPPRRRSTAPLASRVVSEGVEVVVDTTRERVTPVRRGAGDRSSSFGALEDARKNLARRSGFGIPLPMNSRQESSLFVGDNNGNLKSNSHRSSFVGDLSTSPLESTPSLPPSRDPNLTFPDDPHRFHPQRSQSTPSVGVGMEPGSFIPVRTRTVSFAESPAHIIDDDPFLIGSSDEEDETDGGSEKRKKTSGSKKGWWSKGKKRVQSIFSPRTTPPLAPLPSTTTPTLVEDFKSSSSSPSSSPTPPPSKSPNTFQRLFRPPNLPYSNSSFKWAGGSAPDLRTTLASSNTDSSGSLREDVKPATEERRRSVFDPVRVGERGAATLGRKGVVAVQLTDAQLQRRLGRMEDPEERRVAESLFL